MKRIFYMLAAVVAVCSLVACSSGETYAEKLEKERAAIKQFIIDKDIKVIDESDFKAAGNTTDVSKNEYVLFSSTGVYMQIVREGCGEKLKNGETASVLCRYSERNLLADTLISSNNDVFFASMPDKISISNSNGTFTASFISGLMYNIYGGSVPSGWLAPFTYVKLGRPVKEDEQTAKVKLIVPAEQGQRYAAQYTYPCHYEITFERGI
ncbi:MAG: DUF4827 domain-containing protein [Prevotella sp.]|nr:DUF4827 domain-containing protein [Prevotella sp.]